MSRTDRMIGIVLGLIVGVVAVILFVFTGGSNSLDAPSLDPSKMTTTGIDRPADPGDAGSPASEGGGAP